MPISDGIQKITKNLTVNYISCVNWKANQNLWLVTWAPDWQRAGKVPGASSAKFPQISALQSSPQSTVTQLAVRDYDFLHQDHSAYSNDLTPSDYYYLFWNLKFDNDGVRYPWWWMTQVFFRGRWKSVLFNALWRHKLQWRHIRNRLIRVRNGCTFH